MYMCIKNLSFLYYCIIKNQNHSNSATCRMKNKYKIATPFINKEKNTLPIIVTISIYYSALHVIASKIESTQSK